MKVFVDTSALFACLSKTIHVYPAKETFLKLMNRNDRLFTTNYVLSRLWLCFSPVQPGGGPGCSSEFLR